MIQRRKKRTKKYFNHDFPRPRLPPLSHKPLHEKVTTKAFTIIIVIVIIALAHTQSKR